MYNDANERMDARKRRRKALRTVYGGLTRARFLIIIGGLRAESARLGRRPRDGACLLLSTAALHMTLMMLLALLAR